MAKKSTKKTTKKKVATLPPALFKSTGANAALKINDKKRKLYYFTSKMDAEKAKKLAASSGAEILNVPAASLSIGSPSLKYDFYSVYDAEVTLKYVSVHTQELGVYDQLLGAMVGNQVLMPTKGKTIPGKAIFVDVAELYETKNAANHILDGTTGFPAKTLESLFKGAGKKAATAAWIKSNPATPGKFNSLDKVVKAIVADAKKVPKEAKRVVEHTLDFKKLEGFYIPTYYVKVTAGADVKYMRINAVNGNVALKV
jgi:hypothetical protein